MLSAELIDLMENPPGVIGNLHDLISDLRFAAGDDDTTRAQAVELLLAAARVLEELEGMKS